MTDLSATAPFPRFPWPVVGILISATPPAHDMYSAAQEDYFARFHRLLGQWRAQTLYSSFIEEKVQHPAFRQIVEMKEDAIPLILKEIETRQDFLYLALGIITGQDPVPANDRSNPKAAVDAWLAWGEREKLNIS